MTNSAVPLHVTREQHLKIVQTLHEQWMYYEAADRGYDAKSAREAQQRYQRALFFFEAWWGKS